ncbi:hypothetical protein [Acidovorax sp. BL-A-41-H1]|uniref:hypothetical protein n=1 Tax=Acidovorax sp. BL-A-41-H1 TaxID=3421102 RepID=UPI003F7A694C
MLTPERLTEMRRADNGALNFVSMRAFEIIARAVEAEVRKQDDALIRQMLEALKTAGCYPPSSQAAIAAAKARLAES